MVELRAVWVIAHLKAFQNLTHSDWREEKAGLSARLKSIRLKLALVFALAAIAFLLVQIMDGVYDARTADHVRSEYQRLSNQPSDSVAWKAAVARMSGKADAELSRDRLTLIASVCMGLLGLTVAYAAASQTARSIHRLARAAKTLAVGDYRRRISVGSSDELQSLADSFNALGESLIRQEATQKEQAEMLAGMVEAARVASASLDIRECGKAIATAVCAHLGASDAAVYRKDKVDGGIRAIGRCGHRQHTDWKRLAAHSADSGDYLVIAEHENEDDGHPEALLVATPLATSTGTLGAIVAWFGSGLTRDDLRLGNLHADVLGAFAVHAAAAVANAEAHGRTEKYSAALEGWVDHVSAVMHVTEAISTSLNLQEALESLAKAAATVMGADECVIFLPDRDGDLITMSCFASEERREDLHRAKLVPGKSVSGMAFAEKRCVACYDGINSEDELIKKLSLESDLRGMLSAPLLLGDEAIGVIALYCRQPREFTDREKQLLTSIALHAAIVVRNAKLYTMEASIAEALQRSLISEAPDRCRGLAFAGRYMPALDEADIGGDFYDVTPLPNGNVAVVIGDVSGKGLAAAIHLAACKYMLKALVYAHPNDPAKVLGELNDAISYCFQQSFFVTAFLAIIDPDTRTILYASAGHPPALLITENGEMHTRLSSTGLPVGCGRSCEYELETVVADPGDVLLLYTDGVTDAVKAGLRLEIEGLHKMVFDAGEQTGSQIVDRISEQLNRDFDSSRKDDVALLAVSFEAVTAAHEAAGGNLGGEQRSITARAG